MSEADLLRLHHKCDAAWVAHLAEPEGLEFGTALVNAELAEVWNANHVRDVAMVAGMSTEAMWEAVEALFAQRGSRCGYWMMSPTAPAERVRPVVEMLEAKGWRADVTEAMYLRRATPARVADVPGVQVIPMRASYRHAEALMREGVEEQWGGSAQVLEARMRHLDDPHWDALLALEHGQAVAGLGVMAVGELGLVEQVYVSPAARRRGIGRMMLGRALETCARAQFRHVFLGVAAGNEPAKALYRQVGFERVGEVAVYLAPGRKPA